MASASGVTMAESIGEIPPQPRTPYVPQPYKAGIGMQVAQQLLQPMVVDHQFVHAAQDPSAFGAQGFGNPMGRVPSGYSDSGRVGTPALARNFAYPMSASQSTGMLLPHAMQPAPVGMGPPQVGLGGSDRNLLGSGRRQGSFHRLASEPNSLSGTWNNLSAAEMLTINEDGHFNADEYSKISEGSVTPRNGSALGMGGGMPNFQTPRRTGSGRFLSSVTEGGGMILGGTGDPNMVAGGYPTRGLGSAAGRLPSASGRVGTPMVRGSTPYVGDTGRGFSSSGRQLGSSGGRPNISAHGRVRQGSAGVDTNNPLMAQDDQPSRVVPIRTGENVPMWLRGDQQQQQIMTVQEETSPPPQNLPLWLQPDAKQQAGAESRPAEEDSLTPSWLNGGGGGGGLTPRQQERIPTAGMGRSRNRGQEIPESDSGGGRPGTSRGVDMLLC